MFSVVSMYIPKFEATEKTDLGNFKRKRGKFEVQKFSCYMNFWVTNFVLILLIFTLSRKLKKN